MLQWAEDTAQAHITRMETYKPSKAGDPGPELALSPLSAEQSGT